MKHILLTAGIASLVIAGCAYLGNCTIFEKALPVVQKLNDITNDVVVADVAWPIAEPWSYHLVVGLQTNQSPDDPHFPAFSGVVKITGLNSEPVEQFPVSLDSVQHCNWLIHDHNLAGFILTWHETNALRSCEAGAQYTVHLEFKKRPEEFESLWLSYLQSQKQKEQSPNQGMQETH